MHCAACPTRSSIGRLSHSQLQSVWVSLWAWPLVPLLQAPRERPRSRRIAEQRDEGAALHSITSSARASSDDGTSKPSVLAVLRLITSSYLVGACTGRSAGFSPLRMRSAAAA